MTKRKNIGGINAFFVYNTILDDSLVGFGKKYEDFQNGYYWARDWMDSGADPNGLKSEFPFLAIENKQISGGILESDTVKSKFYLVVAAPLECKECENYFSTIQNIEADTFKSLLYILKKCDEVKLYNYFLSYDDYETYFSRYFTPEMWEAFKAANPNVILDSNEDISISIISDFKRWGAGTRDNLIGYSIEIMINYCESIDDDFEYREMEDYLAVTKCKVC